MTGIHFYSKSISEMCFQKMLWALSEMVNARIFNLCHCVQHPWKCTGRDFWTSRHERNPLLQLKCDFRKFCGESQKQWMLELSNICHCVQYPWKLTGRDFWSSRHERKPLLQQIYVLRKCCWVSQKQWMLELSNLCHCIQHPWKLNSRDYWSSMNERKPLSTATTCVLRKCCGTLRNGKC